MADAKVVFETELDTSGLEAGINSLERDGLTQLEFGVSEKTVSNMAHAFASSLATKLQVEFLKATGKTGMAFEAAMAQVAATLGTTVSQIPELERLAKASAEGGIFSAIESAEALEYLARAGWSVDEIMKGFPNMIMLAAAGNMDLATASDLVTDALTAYGLEAQDTAMLVDQLAKADIETNASAKQLGQAMLMLGATGRTAAGGTGEVATALGLLADNGIKGSTAGRQLRNVITSLAAPTDKAERALTALGISAYDSEGNFRPLLDTFTDLNLAIAGMTQEQRTGVISEIFNKEDLRSVNALLGTTTERWTALGKSVYGSRGSAASVAKTKTDTLQGDMNKLFASIEALKLGVYDATLDPLGRVATQAATSVVNVATDAVEAYNNIMDGLFSGDRVTSPNLEGPLQVPDYVLDALYTEDGRKLTLFDMLLPSAGAEEMQQIDEQMATIVQGMVAAFEAQSPELQSAFLAAITPSQEAQSAEGAAEGAESGEGGAMSGLAIKLLTDLQTALQANSATFTTSINNLLTTAKNSADTAQFSSVGAEIAGGIARGIENGTGVVVNAVRRLIEAALAAAQEAADINSPSRLFRDTIGLGIAEGTAVGITDNAYLVSRAIGEMVTDEAYNKMKDVAKIASSSLNKGISLRSDLADVQKALDNGKIEQTINFFSKVATPDEVAQTMHDYATYGLAARG